MQLKEILSIEENRTKDSRGVIHLFQEGTFYRAYEWSPDFVNASPKLRFTVRKVEKWLDCEVLLRQEECLIEVCPVLGHPYSDGRDRFGCLKHLIDTHPNLVNSNESLQFLIYLIGDEAYADMRLLTSSLFCAI